MLKPNNIDRSSADYLDFVFDKLESNTLVKDALPYTKEPLSYDKVIKIDFCGIAASILLVPNEPQEKIHRRFLSLFDKIGILEANRIKLQIRFLFLYTYSDFALAQIEAENTRFRATISNDNYDNRHFDLHSFSVGEIENSSIYVNQSQALNQIQKIHNKYFYNKNKSGILNIRFTCLPLNFCLLTINNETFIDPYSYAKDRVKTRSLFYRTPLSYIESNTEHFSVLKDHFTYIWSHPTTLLFEDATCAIKQADGKLHCLNEIKQPDKVKFEVKASIFKSELNETDDNATTWRFRVEQRFQNMTRIAQTAFYDETLFIGFSWTNGKTIAEELANLIEEDFPASLKVELGILEDAQETLWQELVNKMRSATMGLIIFTKDIPVKKVKGNAKMEFSRPNLYFEFGYLKRHLEKSYLKGNASRTMILAENGLTMPSDLQDFPRFQLTKRLILDYYPILLRIIKAHKHLTEETALNALNRYMINLKSENIKSPFTPDDCDGKSFDVYSAKQEARLKKLINTKFRPPNRIKNP